MKVAINWIIRILSIIIQIEKISLALLTSEPSTSLEVYLRTQPQPRKQSMITLAQQQTHHTPAFGVLASSIFDGLSSRSRRISNAFGVNDIFSLPIDCENTDDDAPTPSKQGFNENQSSQQAHTQAHYALQAEATISNKGAESEVTPQYKRDNLAQPNKSIPAFAVLAGAPTRECSAISSSDDEDKEANVLRRYSEIWESIPAKNSLECNRQDWPSAAYRDGGLLNQEPLKKLSKSPNLTFASSPPFYLQRTVERINLYATLTQQGLALSQPANLKGRILEHLDLAIQKSGNGRVRKESITQDENGGDRTNFKGFEANRINSDQYLLGLSALITDSFQVNLHQDSKALFNQNMEDRHGLENHKSKVEGSSSTDVKGALKKTEEWPSLGSLKPENAVSQANKSGSKHSSNPKFRRPKAHSYCVSQGNSAKKEGEAEHQGISEVHKMLDFGNHRVSAPYTEEDYIMRGIQSLLESMPIASDGERSTHSINESQGIY
ncbi:hypothetical protein FGO68_gene26 [Halteria grandinella]|uniref:Uncharacterized protein n=1 Tax=Halteria grandinella TaxID=5974 RepID=A0A8J8NT93_HALGN|nr:hypothetical protein FGO68_gene26 [Halteria grandinella]